MTETPDNSEGETIADKLSQNMKFTGLLQKNRIDEDEANRRAILSVTRRRFKDEDVTEDAWRENYEEIVAAIQRKVYEDPVTAIRSQEIESENLKNIDQNISQQPKPETPKESIVYDPELLSEPKKEDRVDSA